MNTVRDLIFYNILLGLCSTCFRKLLNILTTNDFTFIFNIMHSSYYTLTLPISRLGISNTEYLLYKSYATGKPVICFDNILYTSITDIFKLAFFSSTSKMRVTSHKMPHSAVVIKTKIQKKGSIILF